MNSEEWLGESEKRKSNCVTVCLDVSGGQSRGFGFVEFRTVAEAERWMQTTQVQLLPQTIS